MSLATCCTSCGTVFRVVQDQLKVSEGWVRCGRCDEVFNALEGLFDLERDAPPSTMPGKLQELGEEPELGAAMRPMPARSSLGDIEPGEERQDTALVERLGAELFPGRQGGERGSTSRFTALEQFKVNDLRIDAELLTDEARPSLPPAIDSELPLVDSRPMRQTGAGAPEFMRHGEEQMQRPWVRVLFSLAAVVLLLLLALQATHHFRDSIAARWPASRGLLAQWCGLAQCSIAPLRRIDDIAVESTTFARAGGPDQFRVSVVLRNRGSLPLAVPSVDLSLTDASGSLLVRKALSPQDFRFTQPVLEPGSENQLQMVLAAGTPLVTGYTVEVFYP